MRVSTFSSSKKRFNLSLLKSPLTLGFKRTTAEPQVLVVTAPAYLFVKC